MVETGVAKFGPDQEYGVVTKEDMGKLVLWAAMSHAVGTQFRTLVRRMMPILNPIDLAAIAAASELKGGAEWEAFALELKEFINRAPFGQ